MKVSGDPKAAVAALAAAKDVEALEAAIAAAAFLDATPGDDRQKLRGGWGDRGGGGREGERCATPSPRAHHLLHPPDFQPPARG